jgi:hypothetical protein
MPYLDANDLGDLDLGDLDLDVEVSPGDEPPSGLPDGVLAAADDRAA